MMAVASTNGPHREDNQDRAAIVMVRFPYDRRPRLQIAIICDGMGGLLDGATAASEAIGAFISVMTLTDAPVEHAICKAVQSANLAVHKRLKGEGGTTLTALVSNYREAWCAHVGDSRLYEHGPEGLNLLTQDDTIQGAIQAHEGGGDEDLLDNRLLQFVGIGESLAPHLYRLQQQADHFWILTSDGAHGLGRKVLESLLERSHRADDVVRRLIFVAEALNVKDNASIAAVKQLPALDESERYSGTTLTITSPSGSLEIWLSDTFAVGDNPKQAAVHSIAADVTNGPLASSGSPDQELTAQKPRRKPKAGRTRSKASAASQQEVLFETQKADDRPS